MLENITDRFYRSEVNLYDGYVSKRYLKIYVPETMDEGSEKVNTTKLKEIFDEAEDFYKKTCSKRSRKAKAGKATAKKLEKQWAKDHKDCQPEIDKINRGITDSSRCLDDGFGKR